MQFGIAFLAGLISFLSPCVLPLIPVYLAYLTGTSFSDLHAKVPRKLVIIHACFFVLGFSLIFIALGASASTFGRLLNMHRHWIERLGGLVLIFFGFWMLGLFRIGFLYRDARFHFQEKPAGFLGSIMVGGAFAAGWTPCVGPVLSAIFVMASLSGSVVKGVMLLTVYSLGFALPLLLCAVALERAIKWLNTIKPFLPIIERATGVFLVLLGVLLIFGWYARLATLSLSYFSNWSTFMFGAGV